MKRWLSLALLLLALALCAGCGEYFAKNEIQVPVYDEKGNPVFGPDGKPVTVQQKVSDEGIWYQKQLEAKRLDRAILVLEARAGQTIELKGVKRLEVWGNNGSAGSIKVYESQWAKMWREWGGIAGMLGGIYLGGQVAVDLADTVGKHAGHNTTVGGDYTRDGSTKYGGDFTGDDRIGGDQIGGDKAGRDINRDSNNTESHEQPSEIE